MLKDLYQSFVIAKAATAANFTIQNLNKRQSEDVGINPDTHFKELMAGIHTDCETPRRQSKICCHFGGPTECLDTLNTENKLSLQTKEDGSITLI